MRSTFLLTARAKISIGKWNVHTVLRTGRTILVRDLNSKVEMDNTR